VRAWLHQHQVTLDEHDFFQRPFTEAELRQLISNSTPANFFSFRSPSFKALGLAPDALNDEAIICLMLREPRFIRRPIVLIGDRLIIGADWTALEAALR
jgi:arsenate reductase-like glutaredoxin family protein